MIVGYSVDSHVKAEPAVSAIRNAIMLRSPVGTIMQRPDEHTSVC